MLFCEEVTCIDKDFLVMERSPLGGLVDEMTLTEVIVGIRFALGEEADY